MTEKRSTGSAWPINGLLACGVLLRFSLIVYGEWQDKVLNLKYTDIDYSVFSDAAVHVHAGGSPYDRETYRYTPLVAYLLLPNIWLHPVWGKVLFSVLDVIAGQLIFSILTMRSVPSEMAAFSAAVWVLNPLPLVVSSRGNAESVMVILVLLTLYFLMKKQNLMAAITLALSVHTKTYPVIYAPSIYLLVNEQYGTAVISSSQKKLQRVISLLWPSDIAIMFTVIGATITIGLAALFYDMYGQVFLDETYLYHITRKDIQHNFSIYFYPLRLAEQLEPIMSQLIGLSAFLPQLGATLSLSYKYYRDLPFCWFMITFTFVTFNKVCTSQYFLWYLCLFPLVVPSLRLKFSDVCLITGLWFTAQVIWFTPAYFYEYHHYDILGWVWVASLYFFWINIWCIWKILKGYSYSPVFNGELLRPQSCSWSLIQSSRMVTRTSHLVLDMTPAKKETGEQKRTKRSSKEKKQQSALTLQWLDDNYCVSEGVCLPRCILYSHYLDFCRSKYLEPACAATFGKVIRQKFPHISTRRLGTRGHSKYHYYGVGIKETSQYYQSAYTSSGLTRFSTAALNSEGGFTRKYSLCSKIGTLLPDFPSVPIPSITYGKVGTLLRMYRTHCQCILDTIIAGNYSEVSAYLQYFWHSLPEHMVQLMAVGMVGSLLALCDTILYETLIDVLIPSTMQEMPQQLLVDIQKLAQSWETWIHQSVIGMPSALSNHKMAVAQRFAQALKRQAGFLHLAQTVRPVLYDCQHVTQITTEVDRVHFKPVTSGEHLFSDLLIQLKEVLHKQATVEALIGWMDTLLENKICKPSGGNPQIFTMQANEFLMQWSQFTAAIMAQLSASANEPSIRLLFMLLDEYIMVVIEGQSHSHADKDLITSLTDTEDYNGQVEMMPYAAVPAHCHSYTSYTDATIGRPQMLTPPMSPGVASCRFSDPCNYVSQPSCQVQTQDGFDAGLTRRADWMPYHDPDYRISYPPGNDGHMWQNECHIQNYHSNGLPSITNMLC